MLRGVGDGRVVDGDARGTGAEVALTATRKFRRHAQSPLAESDTMGWLDSPGHGSYLFHLAERPIGSARLIAASAWERAPRGCSPTYPPPSPELANARRRTMCERSAQVTDRLFGLCQAPARRVGKRDARDCGRGRGVRFPSHLRRGALPSDYVLL